MEIKNKLDKENMRQVIIDSAGQLQKGLALAKDIIVEGNFGNVVICGMGGSTLPADLLVSLNKAKIPFYIHKDYNLPKVANENSLVICISYSGNTEETVSSLQEAIEKKFTVIGISTGGQIETLCTKHQIPMVKIPSGIQPRSAIGYIFSALAKVLSNAKMIEDMSGQLLQASEKLDKVWALLEVDGKNLAKKLVKKVPVIYSSNTLKELARIWKIKFNENSKIPAFYNFFPELNHNEMVGYTNLKKMGAKNFYTLILQDNADHPRIIKRMHLTQDLIKIDPTPVAMVEEFKKMMQQ